MCHLDLVRGVFSFRPSDAGQAAVVRLCQALKETQWTLKRFTDQSESENATLHANALPSKRNHSRLFVLSSSTTCHLKRSMKDQQPEGYANRIPGLPQKPRDIFQ